MKHVWKADKGKKCGNLILRAGTGYEMVVIAMCLNNKVEIWGVGLIHESGYMVLSKAFHGTHNKLQRIYP